MVTYQYSISSSGPTTTIQSAIDSIAAELSSNPLVSQDIVISIGEGSYSGFTIPNGCLFPLFNTSFRLVIKAAGPFFPIIDFNYSDPSQVVGIDIGSGNPNVTIEHVRVQFFAVGIRASTNSHYPIIKNCILSNNRNVNLFLEQCTESQAIQNVIVNGDYGIVTRLCKSSILIHNTIFANGGISSERGKSISCIWAELARDYGSGIVDTGKLHLIGNIAWNTTGRCLTLFASDLEANLIVSNFNNWVKGSKEDFIVVEDNAFYYGPNSTPRVKYDSLFSWKQTGKDSNSKSEDPKFINLVRVRGKDTGYTVDLNLIPVSPVLGMVPSFAFNSQSVVAWLPPYFDSSTLQKDILGKNRAQSGTAAGANDKPTTSGFFGQDVFSNPIDLNILKECEVDPFANILYKSMDLWFPKIRKGYFYSNEREYYLYSKKQTSTLGELSETTFNLPGRLIINKPIKVKISDIEIETKYYDVTGTTITILHKDLPIVNGEEEVNIEGYISTWNGDAFNFNKVLYRFKIKEGTTRYFLPSEAVLSCPVVITDDRSHSTDSDYICNREFYLEYNKELQKTEIVFSNNSNIITNGQFDYYETDRTPSLWQNEKAKVITAPRPYLSVAGTNVCSLEDKGYIRLLLPVSTQEPTVFSFYAMTLGQGIVKWKVEYFDSNYDTLGLVKNGFINVRPSWNRYSLSFSSDNKDYDILVPQVPYPCFSIGRLEPPARAAWMLLEIQHTENPAYVGQLLIDAVQYEKSTVPTLYHRKMLFNETTVEFETSIEDYYIDTHLSLTATSTPLVEGFIYIPEIPASVYGGPRYPGITTLHEWRWPEGRKKVLPWARTKGKDKLRKKTKHALSFIPDKKPEIIAPVNPVSPVRDIEIYPALPSTFVGDSNGIGISIFVSDLVGNPCALYNTKIEISEDNLKYPGVLSTRSYGLKEQLSARIDTRTSSAGVCNFTWVPPLEDAGVYKGNVPLPKLITNSLDRISYISTEYPISYDNYGNVIIFDNNNNQFPIKASVPIKNTYEPTLSESYSTVVLRYPIAYGSVKVIVGSTVYRETKLKLLEENQFFVDYLDSTILVKGRATNIYIEYLPSYVFVSQSDRYKILLYYDKIFGSYENNILLGYDFVINLKATVADPSNNTQVSKNFELIAQNPLTTRSDFYNPIGFEF